MGRGQRQLPEILFVESFVVNFVDMLLDSHAMVFDPQSGDCMEILGSSTFSVVLAQYPLLRRRNLSTYFERYYRNV